MCLSTSEHLKPLSHREYCAVILPRRSVYGHGMGGQCCFVVKTEAKVVIQLNQHLCKRDSRQGRTTLSNHTLGQHFCHRCLVQCKTSKAGVMADLLYGSIGESLCERGLRVTGEESLSFSACLQLTRLNGK